LAPSSGNAFELNMARFFVKLCQKVHDVDFLQERCLFGLSSDELSQRQRTICECPHAERMKLLKQADEQEKFLKKVRQHTRPCQMIRSGGAPGSWGRWQRSAHR
jgi:hypothetical protein